jgi:hypothetical protein
MMTMQQQFIIFLSPDIVFSIYATSHTYTKE